MVGTAGAIIITILVLAAAAAIGWVAYSRWRAQRLGIPPPSFTSFLPFFSKSDHSAASYSPTPRPGGVQGWFSDQVRKFKARNNRTAAGAYEGAPASAPGGGGGRRGFGPLDPDEAWDARVGNEADNYGPGGYYEEQELGLHRPSTSGPYAGAGAAAETNTAYGGASDSYAMNLAATPRGPPEEGGFDGVSRGRQGAAAAGGRNPFDDDAAEPSNISLRGVSPRPMEGEHGPAKGADSLSERRSVFTEQV